MSQSVMRKTLNNHINKTNMSCLIVEKKFCMSIDPPKLSINKFIWSIKLSTLPNYTNINNIFRYSINFKAYSIDVKLTENTKCLGSQY